MKKKKNFKKVDIYYRFTWDTEPTDEQLTMLMEGVKRKVIKQSERIKKKLFEGMEEEVIKTKARYDEL